jgi:hypothetical protein
MQLGLTFICSAKSGDPNTCQLLLQHDADVMKKDCVTVVEMLEHKRFLSM